MEASMTSRHGVIGKHHGEREPKKTHISLSYSHLRSVRADGEDSRVDRTLGVIADAVLFVMPLAQLVAVLPAGCEGVHRSAVHKAGDAVDVRLVGGGVGDVLELLARVDLDLHEASLALGVGDDASSVTVLVVVLPGLPGGLVGDLHLGSVGELGLGGVALGVGLGLVLGLPLLTTLLVLGLDAGVVLLLLVGEDGVRVGADVLVDVAGEPTRPVAVDELRVGVHAHRDRDAVELELDEAALLLDPLFVVTDLACVADGRCDHGVDLVAATATVDGHLLNELESRHCIDSFRFFRWGSSHCETCVFLTHKMRC